MRRNWIEKNKRTRNVSRVKKNLIKREDVTRERGKNNTLSEKK